MADFGLSKGLTFKVPASEYVNREIEDIKYADRMAREQEAVDSAKAQLFSSDLDLQMGSNPIDNAIIQQENKDLLTQLGALAKGNWYTNPDTLAQMKLLKQKYKSSDAVLRSAVYKQSMNDYSKWKQEVAKNPTRYNMDQFAQAENELKNYDGSKPFVFTPPREIADLNAIIVNSASKMDPNQYERWHNGQKGAMMGFVSDDRLLTAAKSIYANNKEDIDYRYKDVEDKVGLIAKELAANAKTDPHFGEVDRVAEAMQIEDYKARKQQAQAQGGSIYESVYLNTASAHPGAKDMASIFGTNNPVVYVDAKGNRKELKDVDYEYKGSMTDDGVQFDKKGNPTGKITGYKTAPVSVSLPLDIGVTEGFLYDPNGFSGSSSPDGKNSTDLEVRPEYADRVEIAYNKDGQPYVKINAVTKFNASNALYKARTESKLMSASQREESGIEPRLQPATQKIYRDKKNGKSYVQVGNGWQEIK
jgi:hypothetical protein